MDKRQKKLIFAVITILMTGIVLFGGLLFRESAVLHSEGKSETVRPSKTVVKNGTDYFPRQDITVILLMGIDEIGPARDSLSYNNQGEADMVALLILDEKEEDCKILTLNRDTMVSVPVLGLGGKQAGTKVAQLALAHTYGSGMEDSCENTRKAVSDFLNGIRIDYYIAMNCDGVAVLNDAVGGVTVEVTDDFSRVDHSIPKGRVTLQGEQALTFVQSRKDVGDNRNLSRMERQKVYMNGFEKALKKQLKQNENLILTAYDAVAPYIVSDLPISTLRGMVERCGDYPIRSILSPEGRNVLGEQYYEFHADREKLDQLVLELFYAPKES